MASITVEVELDDFDVYELADELSSRLLYIKARADKRPESMKSFLSLLQALYSEFSEHITNCHTEPPVLDSIMDELKMDHIHQAFEKYSLTQIEAALPL